VPAVALGDELNECHRYRRQWISACGQGIAVLLASTLLTHGARARCEDQKPSEKKAPEAADSDGVDEPVYDVGGDVKSPRVVHRVMPEFTPKSREQHIEGSVILGTVVTSKGEPRQIHVQKSLEKELDQKAVEALRQWQFAPGLKDNKPVATRVSVEMRFNVL
jgi:TonB family protein